MSLGWREWSRNDIIYGIVAPIVVVLVIVGFSQLSTAFEQGHYGIITGIVSEIEEMLILVAVPLLLGLAWNRWAGGASGFLLGSIYAMWWTTRYGMFSGGQFILGFGSTVLGYVLSAMLIGYMAGALNRRSENFVRMLIVGVVVSTAGGLLLFGLYQLSPSNVMGGLDGFLLTVISRTATGAIIPIIAKVFMWYGIAPNIKPSP